MPERGKISPLQGIELMVSFLLGSAILIIPSAVSVSAKQDAWLAMILATLAGLGIISVYTALALKFPGQTFVQYSEEVLGQFLGKCAGLVMIWFALHLGSLVVRNFGDFMNTYILQQTPMAVINGIMVLLVVFAVKYGLEVLARVNNIMLPVLLFLLLLLTVLALPNVDVRRLLPVMENGVKPVIAGSLSATGFPFAETVLFTMIIPYINRPERVKGAFLLGGLVGGLLLLVVVLRTLLVLGPGTTARSWYSALEAVRVINLYDIIQRVEAVIIINWVGFGFIKIAVCLYAFVVGLAQWLNLKDYKLLVLPAGILMLALSLLVYGNYIEEVDFAARLWTPYAIPITFIIPLIILIVAVIRGSGKQNRI